MLRPGYTDHAIVHQGVLRRRHGVPAELFSAEALSKKFATSSTRKQAPCSTEQLGVGHPAYLRAESLRTRRASSPPRCRRTSNVRRRMRHAARVRHLLSRCDHRQDQEKVRTHPEPLRSPNDLEHGVPLFLTQLSETLRSEATGASSVSAIGTSATLHGRDLLALGFTVSQVVHVYGDVCQAVTELALEQNAPITTTEFHTLNRCLDTAIAEAVTEHARMTADRDRARKPNDWGRWRTRSATSSTRAAGVSHAEAGHRRHQRHTGAVLGRSLMNLRDFVDSTPPTPDERETQRHERIRSSRSSARSPSPAAFTPSTAVCSSASIRSNPI